MSTRPLPYQKAIKHLEHFTSELWQGQNSLLMLLGRFPNLSWLTYRFDISLLSSADMRFSFFSLLDYPVISLGIEGNYSNVLNCERTELKIRLMQRFYSYVLLPRSCPPRTPRRLVLCTSAVSHFHTRVFTSPQFTVVLVGSAAVTHAQALTLNLRPRYQELLFSEKQIATLRTSPVAVV